MNLARISTIFCMWSRCWEAKN